jgi:hypothetical protein
VWCLGRIVIGALAQMGERLLCKQDVIGSIPIGSTNHFCTQCLRHLLRKKSVPSRERRLDCHVACDVMINDIVKRGYACCANSSSNGRGVCAAERHDCSVYRRQLLWVYPDDFWNTMLAMPSVVSGVLPLEARPWLRTGEYC